MTLERAAYRRRRAAQHRGVAPQLWASRALYHNLKIIYLFI